MLSYVNRFEICEKFLHKCFITIDKNQVILGEGVYFSPKEHTYIDT